MTCIVPDVHAIDVLAVIRRRLTDSGGWTELYHLAAMSIDELELIVERELGLGASSEHAFGCGKMGVPGAAQTAPARGHHLAGGSDMDERKPSDRARRAP